MKVSRFLPALLWIACLGSSFGADDATEPRRRPLISTGLSGNEVAFVRKMTSSSQALRQIAENAGKTLEPGEMADFASSLSHALKEELTNLNLLAKNQGMAAPPAPPPEPSEPPAAMNRGQFLAEVLKVRSEQLKTIQALGATASSSIQNFCGAMVQTIQDDLVFIQLISSREQKAAEASRKANAPPPKP